VRIGQEPRVEHQIGVEWHAVLEAEAEEGHDRTGAGATVARGGHECVPQLVHGHVRGVDDLVGHLPDRHQLLALEADALTH
jgi:hypothetical protein